MATPSYEVIKWIPFDVSHPEEGIPLIVWGETTGIHLATLSQGVLQPPKAGYFSHWAKRPEGVSSAQTWVDWCISWFK